VVQHEQAQRPRPKDNGNGRDKGRDHRPSRGHSGQLGGWPKIPAVALILREEEDRFILRYRSISGARPMWKRSPAPTVEV